MAGEKWHAVSCRPFSAVGSKCPAVGPVPQPEKRASVSLRGSHALSSDTAGRFGPPLVTDVKLVVQSFVCCLQMILTEDRRYVIARVPIG